MGKAVGIVIATPTGAALVHLEKKKNSLKWGGKIHQIKKTNKNEGKSYLIVVGGKTVLRPPAIAGRKKALFTSGYWKNLKKKKLDDILSLSVGFSFRFFLHKMQTICSLGLA